MKIRLRSKRFKIIAVSLFFVMVVIILLFSLFSGLFKNDTDSQNLNVGSGFFSLEGPEWLDQEIETASELLEAEGGPVVFAEFPAYVVMGISFYEAETNKLIVDPKVIDEILEMFHYTDDSFTYNKEKSKDGISYFYYDGILSPNKEASLFSGFSGKEDFPQGSSDKIQSIYVKVSASSADAQNVEDADQAFDVLY